MDNISDIIWYILIGGSIIASLIGKAKEDKRKKETKKATRTTPEATSDMPAYDFEESDDTFTPMSEPRSTPRKRHIIAPQPQTASQNNECVTQRMAGNIHPSTIGGSIETELAPISDSELDLHQAEEFDFEQERKKDEAAAYRTGSTIMEDFNIQKAVVWAEVMKPKFNDESN